MEIFSHYVRYDSIPFNPGILIPSVLDDDQPRLISNITTDGKNTEISVMFIWENFPQEFWMYWATGLLMILITTICITWVMNMRITIGKSLEETYSYIWNNYFLNVGQVPDPSYDYSSKTILWFTIIIATFYVIHCTLFNTLSADMTVTSPPRRIESLEDFFDYETFGELTPIISSTSNTYISLKHARKGLEIRLFNKIESNRFSSLVETTTSGENKRITNRIFLKEGVLITDYNIFRLYFLSIYCHIEPLKFSDIKISKGTLTGGIYGMLLAHGTDPEVIKLLNYRIMQLREMKTHDDAIKRSTETYLSLGGISFTFAGYQCLDTIDRKIQEDGIPTDWISIDIAFFADLIKFCFFVQLASIVILMFDRSYHELKGYWQSWHAQKSTHRQSTLFIVRSQPNEKGIIPMPENSRMSRINECDIEEL